MANTSANTESVICYYDCNDNLKQYSSPHPVFSDMTGGTVTQLNMIQLGGQMDITHNFFLIQEVFSDEF